MNNGWRFTSWGNEINLRYGKSLKGYREGKGNTPVFGSNGQIGWTEAEPLKKEPGIILGRKGAYRGVEISDKPFYVIDTAYFVEPKGELDLYWLYSAIKYHKLGEIDDGSPIPSTTRSAVYVRDLWVPPLNEQKKAGLILKSFDDKITLLRQQNATLEAMAQALFKSWFVDFDPVIDNALATGRALPEALAEKAARRKAVLASGKYAGLPEAVKGLFPDGFWFSEELGRWVPEGWESQTLGESTIELRRGLTPKYIEEGGIMVLNQKCIRNHEVNFSLARRNDTNKRKVDGRLLKLHDVLVNSTGMGTLGRVAQLNRLEEPAIVDTHVTVIRPKFEIYAPFVFGRLLLSMERMIESMGEGSTGQTELKRAKVAELSVIVFPVKIQEIMEAKLKAWSDKSSENQREIQTLTRLRDVLLPELISGRVRV